MLPTDLNYLAILVAAIASMVIGAVWYSQSVFGKVWMKLTGKSMKDMKKEDATKGYIVAFAASLVTAYVLAVMIKIFYSATLVGGAKVGILAWAGFVATTLAVEYVFEDRPQKLLLVNSGHILATMIVMGAIIAAWP